MMKNKKIIFGLCLFLLCSCGEGNVNSTTNKDSSNNPLTSEVTPDSSTEIPESTKPEPITDWRADSVSNMEKAIGERLPFAVFTEYYVDESFEDEDGTFIFYVRDPAKYGHAASYRDVLLEMKNALFLERAFFIFVSMIQYKKRGEIECRLR